MEQLGKRVVGAVLSVLVLATAATGCSKSNKTARTSPTQSAAAAGDTGASNNGGSASASGNGGGGGGGGSAAANGGGAVLGDNPGCHLLSASDVTSAAGKPLPAETGNVGGGMQGNTGHQSCLYTADQTGHGADVDVEINTFASGAKDQLTTLNTSQKDQVDSANQITAGSAVLKDVSVGDQGFEVDIHATGANDESVWFVKGNKLVNVEVNSGVAGSAVKLAQEVAGKI